MSESEATNEKYNIFSILGVERKEVIMCRFLAHILDPNGSHGNGDKNLRSFINEILFDRKHNSGWSDEDYKNAWVETEHYIDDNGRRIDIVIATPTKFLPIEVKIRARDQAYQLYDYWEYSKKLNDDPTKTYIWYLTKDGRAPEKESISDKSGNKIPDGIIKRLSFESVQEWVQKLVNISDGMFKRILEQYINTLEQIKSVETLKTDDYLTKRNELIKKVFEGLEEEIKRTFPELENLKGDESHDMRYEKCYDKYGENGFSENNKEILWPGLNYKLLQLKDTPDVALFLRIEIFKKLWVGLVAYNVVDGKEKEALEDEDKIASVWKEIKDSYEICDNDPKLREKDKNWNIFVMADEYNNDPSRRTGSNIPDFQHMNESAISLLYDDRSREIFVKSIVNSIKTNIYDGKEIKCFGPKKNQQVNE